ncbi:MAG: RNA polymerase factor sigma-54 [Cryobacterium sp.]|nr:RNA polymerase factor sigma-54 [Oligoflexia bacterium]
MALEIKQGLRLSQQLVMTPQLQQAIKLLQLNRMELMEVVNQELVDNPVLEEQGEVSESDPTPESENFTEDGGLDAEGQQTRDEEAFSQPQVEGEQIAPTQAENPDDINWENYMDDYNSSSMTSPSMKESLDDLPSFDNALTKTSTLEEHLMWQLSMTNLTEEEKKFGALIFGNLTDEGYLNASFEDIAREAGLELEDAEEVLKLLQNFDPVGVGSRNLRECLLLQAKFLVPRQELVEKILSDHLSDLEKKNYPVVAKALSVSLKEVQDATRVIMEFEPKPGRNFQTSDTHYITPDIYVYKVADEFVISLNEDGLPKLRISPYYRSVLQNAKADPTKGSKDTKDYVQEKLRSAIWLIRSIHNRQKTIYKVTDAIVKRQRDFFDKGVQMLKPMILKDVANDIGMHESTISRVTTNKYVHTPVGIFELKYFFNSSIQSSDGGDALASEAVKEKLRQLVSKEDQKNPLSDQKIVELLSKDNIDIARRTVAKYRDMLGILSSSKRKKVL